MYHPINYKVGDKVDRSHVFNYPWSREAKHYKWIADLYLLVTGA